MNKKHIIGYSIAIIGAFALGILVDSIFGLPGGMQTSKNKNQMDAYPLEISGAGMHVHNQKEVAKNMAPPALRMEIIPDPMKKRNYTLHLITKNFRFAPEAVSTAAVMGEGHAHLYIDDILIQRIYGEWHHIPALKPGVHKIYVTLNFNNHDEYMFNGNTIGAMETITVN